MIRITKKKKPYKYYKSIYDKKRSWAILLNKNGKILVRRNYGKGDVWHRLPELQKEFGIIEGPILLGFFEGSQSDAVKFGNLKLQFREDQI